MFLIGENQHSATCIPSERSSDGEYYLKRAEVQASFIGIEYLTLSWVGYEVGFLSKLFALLLYATVEQQESH